ncbi:MAG: sulfur oxidation c-type cytochrome SoxX [Thiohalophilus sp.]|uniref:sulfur oxidation c-type cytochrome SoxX n=1 Tax=Thiohalophilus sp. TaxID=3028392 RepID=UPI002870637F|nr:sulfur oxidation c-type cytochrome SoxX [Thiohalophilus sp.]MDR9437737.1 sulfur oxidation c-type cytochrome SoxX [Thiohalophilus sp.]
MKLLNFRLILAAIVGLAGLFLSGAIHGEEYIEWEADGYSIPEPLGGLQGDPVRGRAVVIDRDSGNCLACHRMPIPEEPMHGTVAPPLHGVGSRLNEGQLRLRVVNEQRVNPNTIMPAFYKRPGDYHRPHPAFRSTVLTAQEVEDVVAYLMTLK